MSTYFYKHNPKFVYVENFFETLLNLGIYWSIEQYNIDAEKNYVTQKELLYRELTDVMWQKYHKPFVESQKVSNKIKKIFNPLLR